MTVIHKVRPDGRSSGAISGKRMRKALGLPTGSGWVVGIPLHLLNSPAWLALSPQSRKFIDALMAEHGSHGGINNGNLLAPYDQLQARGIRREVILDVVFEVQALGIVVAARGQRSYGSRTAPSTYRLTWFGTPDGLGPTNEWKAIKTSEEAETRLGNARHLLAAERSRRKALRKSRMSIDDVDAAMATVTEVPSARVA